MTLSKKAEDTKERILNSAKQLFAENGFLKDDRRGHLPPSRPF